MRVSLICHFYPPDPCGGAGVYAATLADALRAAGAQVSVLAASDWVTGDTNYNGHMDEEVHGVPVRRLCINWTKGSRPFDYLFDNPNLARPIHTYLEEFQPDVVHVISAYTLSAQAIHVPKSLSIPVVAHLVDMWFICPRHTLLRKNGELCHGSSGDWDCQRCMLWGTKAYTWTGRVLGDAGQAHLFALLSRIDAATRLPGLRGMLGDLSRTRRSVMKALDGAEAVLAPSRTLQALYESNGLPSGRTRLVPYGHDVIWAEQVVKQRSSVLRFAFLGNVLPNKGVHIFTEASKCIVTPEAAEFHVYGYDQGDPAYTSRLRDNSGTSIFWHGEYTRADLSRIFSNIDVVVVPSTWHENNPLVIQEAFAGNCPVISSDVGGAAEGVRHEVDGLHFHTGDPRDLARQMQRLLDDEGMLQRLQSNIRPVRRISDEVAEICALYEQLVARMQVRRAD